MWRRIRTLCFCLVVSVLVAGCGGSASQDDATPDGEREQIQSTEDESSSDTDVLGDETPSPEAPNVPSDPVLDDSTITDSESGSDATTDEPPETEESDSPSNETVNQSIQPEEVTPEESETEAGNTSSADSTSGSSNEPEEITPAPQSLEFGISSGHKSQALDGYVEVPAWARDFQNSTNGSNLQFIVDLKSSADAFLRTPTISYPSGTLRYEAQPDSDGKAIIAIKLKDNDTGYESNTRIGTFTILPAPKNVAPSFTGGPYKVTSNDAGFQEFPGWASGMTDNNTEAVQRLNFKVLSVSNQSLFTINPNVSYPSGTLRYTPKVGASGTAIIKLVLEDDGAGTYGGENSSNAYEFTITIQAPPTQVVVNNAPSFKNLGNQTVDADSGAFALSSWAYDISDGDDGIQALNFDIVSNSTPGLFEVQPTVSYPSGTLRFTPKAGQSGSAEISIRLKDNGGVENGGVDTSDSIQFSISVNRSIALPENSVRVTIDNTDVGEREDSEYKINVDLKSALRSADGSPVVIEIEPNDFSVISLSNEYGTPILMSYQDTSTNKNIDLSAESSAVVFVLRSPRFYGQEFTDITEIAKRIKSHQMFDELVSDLKVEIQTSLCPMKDSCNGWGAYLAEQIAQDIEYVDLVKEGQ